MGCTPVAIFAIFPRDRGDAKKRPKERPMPHTWTDKKVIHLSNKLEEVTSDDEREIIQELVMDYLNYSDQWFSSDDRARCSFLAEDGRAIQVTIGVATVGSSFATVSYCDVDGGTVASLNQPLQRINEFEENSINVEYQSPPEQTRDVVKVRIGETRPLRPLKFTADEG